MQSLRVSGFGLPSGLGFRFSDLNPLVPRPTTIFPSQHPGAALGSHSVGRVIMKMDEREKAAAGPPYSPRNEAPRQAAVPALLRWVPGLALFRDYRREWLRADLLAGVSVCVVMIPSVIAYAGLMGLPPQHGLYAALVPLLVYPFFGSSRQVIVGPDIAISLLIASAITPLAGGDPVARRRPGRHGGGAQRVAAPAGSPRADRRHSRLPLQTRARGLHDRRGLDPDGLAARQALRHPAGTQRLLPASR